MNVGLHHRAEGLVDEPVPVKSGLARERARDDHDPKVSPAIPGASMSGMQMTLIRDIEQLGMERHLQSFADGVKACRSHFQGPHLLAM